MSKILPSEDRFYCGENNDTSVLRAGVCSLGIKQMRQSCVCLIPEEHALALRIQDHVCSTFYKRSFFEHVLFLVEDAIKSVLYLLNLLS